MDSFSQPRGLRRIALLCLLLLAVSGLAQALHTHPQDAVRGDDKVRCNLCVAGTSPQQAAAKVDVVPPQAREFVAVRSQSRTIASVAREASRIRPPPSL
jgi:hypothetical protein